MLSKKKKFILIVLYKRELQECETFRTVTLTSPETLSDITLIVWDNSPVEYEPLYRSDESKFGFSDIIYIRSSRNEKLSTIYNKLIDEYLTTDGYFTIFDHDTEVPVDFFEKIDELTMVDQLIVPRVLSNKNKNLISPRYQSYSKMLFKPTIRKYIRKSDFGYFCSQDFFAIGSGLTITRMLWAKKIRFEEELSFYGVDTDFCLEYSLIDERFIVLDTDLIHDASDEDNSEPLTVKRWRFEKSLEYLSFYLKKHRKISDYKLKLILSLKRFLFIIKNKSI